MSATAEFNEVDLFEGPEKKLEIDFVQSKKFPRGLLDVKRTQWSKMLDLAGCKILSDLSNEKLTSYVLSESSLFVYPFRIVLKTCGTTTLLRCIPKLLEFAEEFALDVEFVSYCRKNFMFPSKQLFPHTSFDSEISTLKEIFPGDAYMLGPITGEHWYLYIADFSERSLSEEKDQTLEIMMTELDTKVMKKFFKDPENPKTAKKLTEEMGLDGFLPAAETDEFLFDPCGFSLNGMSGFDYYTIHVTPEDTHSYVSFETNLRSAKGFNVLISNVLRVFQPNKFSVTLFTDHSAPASNYHHQGFRLDSFQGYVRTHKTTQEFEADYVATLTNYVSRTLLSSRPPSSRPKHPPSTSHSHSPPRLRDEKQS